MKKIYIGKYRKENTNNNRNRYGRFNENSRNKLIVVHKPYYSSSLSPKKNKKVSKSNPFSVASKHKTNFGYVYLAGGIPCQLDFNGPKMGLRWYIEPKDLDYEKILELCFEGLLETEHPYKFIANQCIKDMLTAKNSYEKVINLLPALMVQLRKALQSNNEAIFTEAMDILKMVSLLVKEKLNPLLFLVLQQINKRSFNMKYKEKVFDLLREIELNGGKEAYLIIKDKIPTYNALI